MLKITIAIISSMTHCHIDGIPKEYPVVEGFLPNEEISSHEHGDAYIRNPVVNLKLNVNIIRISKPAPKQIAITLLKTKLNANTNIPIKITIIVTNNTHTIKHSHGLYLANILLGNFTQLYSTFLSVSDNV